MIHLNQRPAIELTLTHITPPTATVMLESNVNNRALAKNVVNRYADDMKRGFWGVSETAICFDVEEHLFNGQHRLWAVCQSDIAIYSIVARGYPLEAMHWIDDPFRRTAQATWNLTHDGDPVNTHHLSITRVFHGGVELHGTKQSRQSIFDTLTTYRDGIDFSVSCFPTTRRGLTTAPVMAVVARAYYSAGGEPGLVKLRRFCEVLITGGYTESEEQVILLLREYILTHTRHSRDTRVDRYYRTERCLQAYLRRELIAKLYPVKEEVFPVPDEGSM